MPTFQIRNKRTRMVLGEVTVNNPERVLDELKDATGSSIEDIAQALGSTLEEATASLDIVVLKHLTPDEPSRTRGHKPSLPARGLFA